MSQIRKTIRRNRLQLENLESRALLAVNPVYMSGGWLNIVGTNNTNDQASVVDTNPNLPNSQVLVFLNGQPYGFWKQQITQGVKFYGYGGNDSFSTGLMRKVHAWGGTGNDTLNGSSMSDELRGEAGTDLINGYGGNDSIWGGSHNDTINGGTGNDWITGQTANDDIDGEDGNDTLYGYTGNDTLRGGDGNDTLSGWDGSDDLYGNDGNDKMWGHAGEDYMNGHDGNDWMDGGDDFDIMHGGNNNDTMFGSEGDDTMHGGAGADSMQGGSWNDEMYGDDGNDFMTGQSGHDSLYGGDHNDEMYGYTGNDLLVGDAGNDTMSGWDGNDLLYGREGNDDLYGHSGRDGLMGGNGLDYVSGGSDSDRFLTIGDEDEIATLASEDAAINFSGPKVWSYGEIEIVDGGLARLHHRTENTVLLKDPQKPYDPADPKKPRLFIERDDIKYIDEEPTGYDGWNNGQVITVFDKAFEGSDNWVQHVVIHEIGHNWDTPPDNDPDTIDENIYELSGENVPTYFRTLSGWRSDLGDADVGDELDSGGQTYVKAGNATEDDNPWWYLKGTVFVSNYAKTSASEDFADTLAAVVMGSDFANGGGTPFAPTAKRAWLNAWLNNV